MDTSEHTLEQHRQQLQSIGSGKVHPGQAFVIIRDALTYDAAATSDHVYEALRAVVFEALVSRSSHNLDHWCHICLSARAHLNVRNCQAAAERISVLVDMLSQMSRFNDFHPMDELMSRKNSQRILGALLKAEQPLSHADLAEKTGLPLGLMPHFCAVLAIAGLIQRRFVEKQQQVELSQLGRHELTIRSTSPIWLEQFVKAQEQL